MSRAEGYPYPPWMAFLGRNYELKEPEPFIMGSKLALPLLGWQIINRSCSAMLHINTFEAVVLGQGS